VRAYNGQRRPARCSERPRQPFDTLPPQPPSVHSSAAATATPAPPPSPHSPSTTNHYPPRALLHPLPPPPACRYHFRTVHQWLGQPEDAAVRPLPPRRSGGALPLSPSTTNPPPSLPSCRCACCTSTTASRPTTAAGGGGQGTGQVVWGGARDWASGVGGSSPAGHSFHLSHLALLCQRRSTRDSLAPRTARPFQTRPHEPLTTRPAPLRPPHPSPLAAVGTRTWSRARRCRATRCTSRRRCWASRCPAPPRPHPIPSHPIPSPRLPVPFLTPAAAAARPPNFQIAIKHPASHTDTPALPPSVRPSVRPRHFVSSSLPLFLSSSLRHVVTLSRRPVASRSSPFSKVLNVLPLPAFFCRAFKTQVRRCFWCRCRSNRRCSNRRCSNHSCRKAQVHLPTLAACHGCVLHCIRTDDALTTH
jgi:hypothetical protein